MFEVFLAASLIILSNYHLSEIEKKVEFLSFVNLLKIKINETLIDIIYFFLTIIYFK